MSQVPADLPADLKYLKTHEWIRVAADGSATVGITDFAQASLGDLVFVETPAAGRKLARNEACAVVESVKAASDVYAPLAGTVLAANEALASAPELLNSDPYGAGWLWKMQPDDAGALDELLDAAAYEAFLKTL